MRSSVYGWNGYVYGHMIASVSVASLAQARLLMEMLEREMRERAGQPAEGQLADWYNSLVRTCREAERKNWPGWEDRIGLIDRDIRIGRRALEQEGG